MSARERKRSRGASIEREKAAATHRALAFVQPAQGPPARARAPAEARDLWLEHNALPIPTELVRSRNARDIITYYFASLDKTTRPLDEVKLLLLGQGEVGKSSLVNRLVRGRFDSDERKTEGIQRCEWTRTIGGDTIRVHVWDFGGQEIIHATHQFFLSERSLYVVVVNARRNEDNNNLHHWLETSAHSERTRRSSSWSTR